MSKNSWLVGTTGISFHWVFILAAAWWEAVVGRSAKVAGTISIAPNFFSSAGGAFPTKRSQDFGVRQNEPKWARPRLDLHLDR